MAKQYLTKELVGKFADAWLRTRARFHKRAFLDNELLRNIFGLGFLGIGALPILPRATRLKLLLKSLEISKNNLLQRYSWSLLKPWLSLPRAHIWRSKEIGWDRYFNNNTPVEDRKTLATSLLLKAPGINGELGVLYCSFEYNWLKILTSSCAKEVLNNYLLVGASSWSPTHFDVFCNFIGVGSHPAFIGISNHQDSEVYKLFHPTVYPVSIMACDWINPDYYHPRPHAAREIDILMVAHWESWKRHWILFEALSKMNPNLNVVLIGRNSGARTVEALRKDANAFGVRQDVTILTNISIEEVAACQCNARISVICTKTEGSCVSVTESMFADSPVAMVENSHVGSSAYINPQTGIFFRRRTAHLQLSEMLERSDTFSARSWAENHISATQSSQKLNDILSSYCQKAGLPWTTDIAPLCWHYVPEYLSTSDRIRLRPAVESFNITYGLEIKTY